MLCPRCAAAVGDEAAFCTRCGQSLTGTTARESEPEVSAGQVAPSGTAVSAYASEATLLPVDYAPLLVRCGAFIIDFVVICALEAVVSIFTYNLFHLSDVAGFAMGLSACSLYFAILESQPAQATLGKRAFGIVVTDRSGRRIGFWRALGRFAGKLASYFTLGIGFLIAAFTPRKQALHDLITGTLVVTKRRTGRIGIEDMTGVELAAELQRGGKFVVYLYCVSLIVLTFKRGSHVYFVRAGESATAKALPYVVLSALVGWWGIPWGPIFTIEAMFTNLSGGKDVTQQVLASLWQQDR